MRKEQVLEILENSRGGLVTGGEIARRLGVSRTAVWKAVSALREGGSLIESFPNSGYRLSQYSDSLSQHAIRRHLAAGRLGGQIEILETVSSTNEYLRQKELFQLPEGYTVIADEQTSGRGRMGRTFYSPARQGVYLSCLLKPGTPAGQAQIITLCAAVAVCRALEAVCGASAGIKWVNDIFVGGKKLCGILTEGFVTTETQSMDLAVVGIGINTGEVYPQVEAIATSVLKEWGLRGIRGRLIAEVLNQLGAVITMCLEEGRRQEVLDEYCGRLILLGKTVEVNAGGPPYQAVVRGIGKLGELIVEKGDGTVLALSYGEAALLEVAENA